jgi:hypothetical protein
VDKNQSESRCFVSNVRVCRYCGIAEDRKIGPDMACYNADQCECRCLDHQISELIQQRDKALKRAVEAEARLAEAMQLVHSCSFSRTDGGG